MSVQTNVITKKEEEEEKLFSFRDYVPNIKINKNNDNTLHISTFVKTRFDKYKRDNGARSESHAVHMLIEENKSLRQIMFKLNIALKKAENEENVDVYIVAFAHLADNKEKAHYEAIRKGLFD